MGHNELRRDYLLDRWVVIATERSRRPTDFIKQKSPHVAENKACPLCPGNERMTPPAIMVYLSGEDEIRVDKDENGFRHSNWLIRCIPNLYPAFTAPDEALAHGWEEPSEGFGYAIGHHEVIVESPCHEEHPADASVPQLILLVNAYLDRVRNLSAKSYVKYVSVFRNYGLEAGASLSHPHSQIITTPFVPRTVREEITAAERFWHMHGKCVFCDIMAREIDGPRIVLADRYFTVVAPYASVHPMEFWIIPRRHTANLLGLTEDEKRELAGTLKKSLKALKDTVGDPAYNFGFHFSTSRSDEEYYHWHLEVYPKLSVWAGFEKNTGMYINTVTPETAAAELKKAIELAPQTSV